MKKKTVKKKEAEPIFPCVLDMKNYIFHVTKDKQWSIKDFNPEVDEDSAREGKPGDCFVSLPYGNGNFVFSKERKIITYGCASASYTLVS